MCSCCVSMAQAVMEHPGGLTSHRDLPFVFCQLAPAPLFLFCYYFKAKAKEAMDVCLQLVLRLWVTKTPGEDTNGASLYLIKE